MLIELLVLVQDLLKNTPEDHPDYHLLMDTLRKTEQFVEEINAIDGVCNPSCNSSVVCDLQKVGARGGSPL